ncbi:MAG: Gldg family protein, partial [Burkholderiaceae bacterium]
SYTSLSNGKLTLEVIDPKPFSDEEDRAVGLGINRFSIAGGQDALFFGVAGTNSTDGKAVIPVFAPDREPHLEYDLTRMVSELGRSGKPKVAIFDGIGLAGNPMNRLPPQQIQEQLGQFFETQTLFGDIDQMPENTRVVMLIHPQDLSDRTLYTIDQWVLSGGALMVFVDPYAEMQPGMRPGMPPQNPGSHLEKLFKAWGVKYDPTFAVGDPAVALRTVRNVAGRQMQVANYAWLGLRGALFSPDDPVMAKLNTVFMTTAGSFDVEDGKGVTMKPLIISSPESGTLPAMQAGNPQIDPSDLVKQFKKTSEPLILAARLGGKLSTAFPDGKPKDSTSEGEALKESTQPLNVMLFGDADMLMDRNWIQQREVLGQPVAQAFANNGDLVLNAAEQMAGGAVLAGLRGRGVAWRPFERIDALERQAEAQHLAKEQDLMKRLQDAEKKIVELSRESAPKKGELFSDEGTAAIEKFRSSMLATRAELREVQFNLRSEVDQLKSWVTALNVAVVPAIIAVLALIFAFRRPRRKVPPAPSASRDDATAN